MNKSLQLNWAFQNQDLRTMVPSAFLDIDQEKTNELRADPKHQNFTKWLLDNGAKFHDVEYPCVFKNGVVGVAAKSLVKRNRCYLSIPNKCIISVPCAFNSDLKDWFIANPALFGTKHPDKDQLIICAFLCRQKLIGTQSFFHPYLQVMNPSEPVHDWTESHQFNDQELFMDLETNRDEIHIEWDSFSKAAETCPLLEGLTKEIWVEMLNYSCTRCFGWTLPCTMMVPLADFQNHCPLDTTFDVVKTDRPRKQSNIDFSILYSKEFLEHSFDPQQELEIKGVPEPTKVPRGQQVATIKVHLSQELGKEDGNVKLWEQGYKSTDCGEDNDTDAEEEEDSEEPDSDDDEDYDDEDEDDKKSSDEDVQQRINRENEVKHLSEEEKKFMESQSAIEKDIEKSVKTKTKQKASWSWWRYDDEQTYFTFSSQGLHQFGSGQQILTSYGRRSNKFLLTFYGFCFSNNKHDSVQVRVRRKLLAEAKIGTIRTLAESLILTDAENKEEYQKVVAEQSSKRMYLKRNKLNPDILSYLRAHLLVRYEGDIVPLKMTEPVSIDFELLVLEAYRSVLDVVMERHNYQLCEPSEIESQHEYRRQIISTYRNEKHCIMMHQFSIVASLEKVLKQIKLGVDLVTSTTMVALCSHDDLINLLNARMYLKLLWKTSQSA